MFSLFEAIAPYAKVKKNQVSVGIDFSRHLALNAQRRKPITDKDLVIRVLLHDALKLARIADEQG